MFDMISNGLDAAQVRPMILSSDVADAEAGLSETLGGGAVMVASPEELAADWPDYVVARARTGGALVAEGAREGATFMRLAEGFLKGRPAVAGLLSGALVFLVEEAVAQAQAA